MKSSLVFLLFLLGSSAYAQQPIAPVEAISSGACSPNIIGNKGEVNISCYGITDSKTATKIVEILNEILRKQSDPERMSSKLDEILTFVRQQSQEIAAVKVGLGDLKKTTEPRTLLVEQKTRLAQLLPPPAKFQVLRVISPPSG